MSGKLPREAGWRLEFRGLPRPRLIRVLSMDHWFVTVLKKIYDQAGVDSPPELTEIDQRTTDLVKQHRVSPAQLRRGH